MQYFKDNIIFRRSIRTFKTEKLELKKPISCGHDFWLKSCDFSLRPWKYKARKIQGSKSLSQGLCCAANYFQISNLWYDKKKEKGRVVIRNGEQTLVIVKRRSRYRWNLGHPRLSFNKNLIKTFWEIEINCEIDR